MPRRLAGTTRLGREQLPRDQHLRVFLARIDSVRDHIHEDLSQLVRIPLAHDRARTKLLTYSRVLFDDSFADQIDAAFEGFVQVDSRALQFLLPRKLRHVNYKLVEMLDAALDELDRV